MHQFLYIYLFYFSTLYMFRALCAVISHGHQYGLTITEAVLKTISLSPEDGHIVPETCRELKNKINKYIKSGASNWFSVRKIHIGCLQIQYGIVLRRSYVLEYLVVNRIVLKRVLFKWFKMR
jgi:hypothetical protein